MKKALSVLAAITVALSSSISAYAWNENEVEGYVGYGQSTINAHAYSSFDVEIPAVIDLSEMGGGEVAISNADIDNGYQVEIYVTNLNENGKLNMNHTTKSGVTSELTLTGSEGELTADAPILARFKDTDLESGYANYMFSGEMVSGSKAGNYSGVMMYSIFCNRY